MCDLAPEITNIFSVYQDIKRNNLNLSKPPTTSTTNSTQCTQSVCLATASCSSLIRRAGSVLDCSDWSCHILFAEAICELGTLKAFDFWLDIFIHFLWVEFWLVALVIVLESINTRTMLRLVEQEKEWMGAPYMENLFTYNFLSFKTLIVRSAIADAVAHISDNQNNEE